MLSPAVVEAIERGDAAALETLVLEEPAVVLSKDKRGKTALYYAARVLGQSGCDCVSLLIQNRADVNARARNGKTALSIASETGNLLVFDLLLEAGASFNIQDRDGMSPIHGAATYGRLAVVRKLLERGSKINTTSTALWTPLHFAAKNNHFDIVRLLVKFDADVGAKTEDKETALTIAHQVGSRSIVEFLLPKVEGELNFYGSKTVVQSLDNVMLQNTPDNVMAKLNILGHMHGSAVPENPTYSVARKRPIEDLSPVELAGLLMMRQLPYFSRPFLEERVSGLGLVNMKPEFYAKLFGRVQNAFCRTQGKSISEEEYHTVLWRKLQHFISDLRSSKGVDDETLQRGVAAQSISEMENFEDAFRAIDFDGSGSLSVDELVPVLDTFGRSNQQMSVAETLKAFHEADKDGSRSLSLEEFKTLYNNLASESPRSNASGQDSNGSKANKQQQGDRLPSIDNSKPPRRRQVVVRPSKVKKKAKKTPMLLRRRKKQAN